MTELDPQATEQLTLRLAAAVRSHYLRTIDEPNSVHVFEALNALASVTALVLTGADNSAQVRDWFESALDRELADLVQVKE